MTKDTEKSKQDSLPLQGSSSEPTDEPVEESKRGRKKPLTEEEIKEYEEWVDSLPELPRIPKEKGERTVIFIPRKPAAPSTDKE
jgi:hypothetical protein